MGRGARRAMGQERPPMAREAVFNTWDRGKRRDERTKEKMRALLFEKPYHNNHEHLNRKTLNA